MAEIVDVKTRALMMDPVEADKLDKCLAYCNHRLSEHLNDTTMTGLQSAGVDSKFVSYMRGIIEGLK